MTIFANKWRNYFDADCIVIWQAHSLSYGTGNKPYTLHIQKDLKTAINAGISGEIIIEIEKLFVM